jgi:hypothetical protein
MSSSECITSFKYFVDPYLNCGVIRGPKKRQFSVRKFAEKISLQKQKDERNLGILWGSWDQPVTSKEISPQFQRMKK